MLVSTGGVSNILANSADVTGTVVDLGEGASQHGHCYNTSPNVNVSMNKTQLGPPAGAGGFTSNLEGLQAGTKYYVKAYMSKGSVTVYGSEINFTTAAASLPTVTTSTITDITQVSASAGGNVTNEGGAPVTERDVCYGTAAVPTVEGSSKTTNGEGFGTFASPISGLTPGITYYVRAYAKNSAGVAYGEELSFMTLKLPTATTAAPTAVSNNSATLSGTVNANNFSTVVTFEYGMTTAYGMTVTASQSPVTGNAVVNVSAGITGLSTGVTYHYRVKAVNSAGTVYGEDMTFITAQLAAAVTNAATSVTGNSAVLNGSVNANNLSTVVTFEYGTTTSYGLTATANQSPVTGNSNTPVSSSVASLAAGTTYHFRVKAVNSSGDSYGEDLTFTTPQAPSASTSAATSVTSSGATLNGSVNANGSTTTVVFEYGLTTAYGSEITAAQSPLAGSNLTSVSAALSGLQSGTTYNYRIRAVSIGGTIYGSNMTFTTLSPPSATTQSATGITASAATFNGTVNANNSSTTVTFEYGTTTAYGSSVTAAQSPVSGSAATGVSYGIAGLTANTTYHYRVKAVSAGGTTYGSDIAFNTLQLPSANATQAANLAFTTATLNGTVNANGSSTTVTFEYGLTTSYGQTATAANSPVTGTILVPVSVNLTGLTAGSTYNYRVKAVSAAGTTYSGNSTFTLVPTTVTDIDGNVYNVVIIGTQVWLKENLRTTKYNNGVGITPEPNDASWAAMTAGAYCDYNNQPANSNPYGRLYNFYTIGDNTKLCPAGWHVPTVSEAQVLSSILGGASVAGGKMKETGTIYWASPNTGATNSSGFTGIATNYRSDDGSWVNGDKQHSNMWTATGSGTNYGMIVSLHSSSADFEDGWQDAPRKMGFPIRCIKNY